MTHIPAHIGLEPDVRDVLLQQVQDENAALHVENGRLRAENERLRSEGSAKDAEIERQRAEIAALQARLGRPKKTPRNSSLPLSQAVKPNASGQPAATPAHPRRGHAGAHRPLCDNPTEVKDMRAGTCPHCAADLSGMEQSAGETYDHVEIPLASAVITRVILRRGTCPCCRTAFKAEPPLGMEPGSPFGENLRATVVHLRQCHAVSYERLAAVLDVQFGVKLSEGTLAAMLKAAAPLPRALGDARAADRGQHGRRDVPPQPGQVAGQAVRLSRRAGGFPDQQRFGAGAALECGLPQGHQLLPIGLGRQAPCRRALGHRNSATARDRGTRGDPADPARSATPRPGVVRPARPDHPPLQFCTGLQRRSAYACPHQP